MGKKGQTFLSYPVASNKGFTAGRVLAVDIDKTGENEDDCQFKSQQRNNYSQLQVICDWVTLVMNVNFSNPLMNSGKDSSCQFQPFMCLP